jgi:hypothetical protein
VIVCLIDFGRRWCRAVPTRRRRGETGATLPGNRRFSGPRDRVSFWFRRRWPCGALPEFAGLCKVRRQSQTRRGVPIRCTFVLLHATIVYFHPSIHPLPLSPSHIIASSRPVSSVCLRRPLPVHFLVSVPLPSHRAHPLLDTALTAARPKWSRPDPPSPRSPPSFCLSRRPSHASNSTPPGTSTPLAAHRTSTSARTPPGDVSGATSAMRVGADVS